MTLSQSASLPKLPGYSTGLDLKSDHKRINAFDYSLSGPVYRSDEERVARSSSVASLHSRSVLSPSHSTSSPSGNHGNSFAEWGNTNGGRSLSRSSYAPSPVPSFASTSSLYSNAEQYEPRHVKLDKKVLRFHGYFIEPVHQSTTESFRVRRLVLYIYLEDDTIMITEPKIENSGVPQGLFLKRQAVPKSDGSSSPLSYFDFRIGSAVQIYGREIHLVDCDKFTREFYSVNGMELSEALPVPDDTFSASRSRGSASPAPTKDSFDLKGYIEHSLGHGKPKDATQFLNYDRQVLRFFATWDDPDLSSGGKKDIELNFFLADDTVEVRQIVGGKQFGTLVERPRLFKRGPLPKKVPAGQPGQVEVGETYKAEDFRVGGYVSVFGREMFLHGCDKFTQEFYKRTFGLDFSSVPSPTASSLPTKKSIKLPPPTGFGSEEDSLGSVFALRPKPPKKNFFQLSENQNKILRFSCSMVSNVAEMQGRQFILTYFLADDTLALYEPPVKNCGFANGKFLERNKYVNPNPSSSSSSASSSSPRYFTLDDIFVGATLKINNWQFMITGADQFTIKYQTSRREGSDFRYVATDEEIGKIENKIRRAFATSKKRFTDMFRSVDVNKDSFITIDEFKRACHQFGFTLTDDELMAVFAHYDQDGEGLISYKEFIARVNPETQSHHESPPPSPMKRNGDSLAMRERAMEMERTQRIRNDVKQFSEIIRSSNFNVTDYWRALSAPAVSLTKEEFAEALKLKKLIYGQLNDSLVAYFFPEGRTVLTVAEFAYDVGRINDIESMTL